MSLTLYQKMLPNTKMTPTSKTKTPGKVYCSHDKETLIRELKTLREEREKDCQLRKHLNQELKTLNTQVLCKVSSLIVAVRDSRALILQHCDTGRIRTNCIMFQLNINSTK